MKAHFRAVLWLAGILVVTYVGFVAVTTIVNRNRWNSISISTLRMLYQSWVKDGRPATYEVTQYLKNSDKLLQIMTDTNVYSAGNDEIRGLFKLTYHWDGALVTFMIETNGVVFQLGKDGRLRKTFR